MTIGAVADMLPRQRRAGVATDGARRERMRPWQRPLGGHRDARSVRGSRASPGRATELRIPGVAFPGTVPRERPASGQRPDPDPATAGGHPPPPARPRPTVDIRPISGRNGTVGHLIHGPIRSGINTLGRRRPGQRIRSAIHPPHRRPTPGDPREHTVREAGLAPRTGPPPAGNEAAISPSPPHRTRRADPRTTHASAASGTGPERTCGRTATHRGARAEPSEDPGRTRRDRAGRQRTRTPRAPVRAGRQGEEAARRSPYTAAAKRNRTPSRTGPHPAPAISTPPPPHRRHSPALPFPFLRRVFASTAPHAPRVTSRPTAPRAWPGRTTIPPYGRPALNGRDATNYAGCTDVLCRAAYSPGHGQMRVRAE